MEIIYFPRFLERTTVERHQIIKSIFNGINYIFLSEKR